MPEQFLCANLQERTFYILLKGCELFHSEESLSGSLGSSTQGWLAGLSWVSLHHIHTATEISLFAPDEGTGLD